MPDESHLVVRVHSNHLHLQNNTADTKKGSGRGSKCPTLSEPCFVFAEISEPSVNLDESIMPRNTKCSSPNRFVLMSDLSAWWTSVEPPKKMPQPPGNCFWPPNNLWWTPVPVFFRHFFLNCVLGQIGFSPFRSEKHSVGTQYIKSLKWNPWWTSKRRKAR